MSENIPNPYYLSSSFCHKKCSPDIEKKASPPNQNIFDCNIYLFTIFWSECPLIINDTIDNSSEKRTRKSCIDIINAKQLCESYCNNKIYYCRQLRGQLCSQKHKETVSFRNYFCIFFYPINHLNPISKRKLYIPAKISSAITPIPPSNCSILRMPSGLNISEKRNNKKANRNSLPVRQVMQSKLPPFHL